MILKELIKIKDNFGENLENTRDVKGKEGIEVNGGGQVAQDIQMPTRIGIDKANTMVISLLGSSEEFDINNKTAHKLKHIAAICWTRRETDYVRT